MRALGLLSILVALVIVGLLAKKQLEATHQSTPGASAQAASKAGVDLPKVDSAADARRLQEHVQDDINRAMQGRASQVDTGVGEADKP